jgi:nitrite reductase/ring-hydroxylating ferredoxin subunit
MILSKDEQNNRCSDNIAESSITTARDEMMPFVDVARLSDIPVGSSKKVELPGKEILLVNVGGKIYATDDRCGHMNAPLSMGTVHDNTVECAMHHAIFDVVTGKNLREAHLGGVSGAVISKTRTGGMIESVKTYDLGTYEVVVVGDVIKVDPQAMAR